MLAYLKHCLRIGTRAPKLAALVFAVSLSLWLPAQQVLAQRTESTANPSATSGAAGFAGARSVMLMAGDAKAGDNFGDSVAISGDVLVVGTHYACLMCGPGAAYVFERGNGKWRQRARLQPSEKGPPIGMQFGRAVAVDDNTVVVGAPNDEPAGRRSGSAYVFARSGSQWKQQARLVSPIRVPHEQFGSGVAISGKTIVVGAQGDNDQNTYSAVYVFERTASGWDLQAKLDVEGHRLADGFGYSIGISGDTVLVGCPFAKDDKGIIRGAGYVFQRSGAAWKLQAKLTEASGMDGGRLGLKLAIDGNVAMLGDNSHDRNIGAVFAFERKGDHWGAPQRLTADDRVITRDFGNANFGFSIAIEGNLAAITSNWFSNKEHQNSLYLFERTDSGWVQRGKLAGSQDRPGSEFGRGVGLSGKTIVVGAPRDGTKLKMAGAAHVFEGARGAR